MKEAVLTYEECQALAELVNRAADFASDDDAALASAAAKIEAVISGPKSDG